MQNTTDSPLCIFLLTAAGTRGLAPLPLACSAMREDLRTSGEAEDATKAVPDYKTSPLAFPIGMQTFTLLLALPAAEFAKVLQACSVSLPVERRASTEKYTLLRRGT